MNKDPYNIGNEEVIREKPTEESEMMEFRLRALHDLLPEALSFPNLASQYVTFVRTLRERLHPLGKRQIRVVETESGLKFKVDLGDRFGCDFYYGYYQEIFDSRLFLDLIDTGTTVLDVGANFGYYTVMAALKVGPLGIVHAFEPNKDAYKLLENNVRMNKFHKIVCCHNYCVGDKDCETDFYVSEESSFSSMGLTGRSKLLEEVKIPMRSLDSLLQEKVDAIKIDVEGYEFAVLQGALETIKRSPNVVIMMEVCAKNLNDQRRQELIAALTVIYKLGFQGWIIGYNPDELRSLKTPQDAANLGSANLFLVVSESEREQQLHQAFKKLHAKAFQSISKEIGIHEEPLLRKDVAGPYTLSSFHNRHTITLIEHIHKRDEELLQLNKDIAYWKQEATSGIGRQIIKRLKDKFGKIYSGSS